MLDSIICQLEKKYLAADMRLVNDSPKAKKTMRGISLVPFTILSSGLDPLDKNKKLNPLHVAKMMKLCKAFFDKCVAEGHEGAVVKVPSTVYSFRKNDDWLKMKPYKEADLKIDSAVIGKGKHAGKLGACFCVGNVENVQIRVRVGGGYKDHERVALWKLHKQGKLVGRIMEMKHEGLTAKNAVRFPRFYRMRPDKRKPN